MSRSHLSRSVLAGLAVAGLVASLGGSPAAGATPPLGRVFMVNPVQSSGDQSLTDHKDSATAVPQSQYVDVPLTNLDGSGYLRGDWASVVSTTGKPVSSKTGYLFDRSADQFEQVMAYYWVTQAQLYIQSLGFGSELRPVNERQQLVRINQFGGDNSFYRPGTSKLTITLGKGGVDDAEDAEVVVHEYGHSVQDDQVPGFGSTRQAGSIGEAFGDYLAVEVGLAVAGQPAAGVPAACVADWDSTSYTSTVPHCLRRVDGNKTVADVVGEVHADGEIWSAALWDIRSSLGATVADRIIINAQFGFAPDTSFAAAAQTTVDTARQMYGTAAAAAVTKAFQDRRIL